MNLAGIQWTHFWSRSTAQWSSRGRWNDALRQWEDLKKQAAEFQQQEAQYAARCRPADWILYERSVSGTTFANVLLALALLLVGSAFILEAELQTTLAVLGVLAAVASSLLRGRRM